jgi:hypothetical protein
VVVAKATPAITWSNPAAITSGTPLSGTQLNATSPVEGTFSYIPPMGTVLNAGTNTLTAVLNATDTNNNFVSADYNEKGNACGLNGNGTNKSLNTGLNASAFSSFRNLHMGIGLRKTTTGTGFRVGIGAFRYLLSGVEWSIKVRRGDANVAGNCMFGDFVTSSNTCGDSVSGSALRTGNIIASWPTMSRNGDRSGIAATAGQNITGAAPFFVFAMIDSDPSALGVVDHSDIRLDWYSIGAAMSGSLANAFNLILAEFQTALNRS